MVVNEPYSGGIQLHRLRRGGINL